MEQGTRTKPSRIYVPDQENIMDSSADTDIPFLLQHIKLVFGKSSGHLKSVEMNGVSENIEQNFAIYKGALGDNSASEKRSSGA